MTAGRARERVEARALPAYLAALHPLPARYTPNRAEGRQQAAGRGWTGLQWRCLLTLWDNESQWDEQADNPTSTAYGIAQALPGRRMASAGADWRTSAPTQIRWGLAYIGGRYGTPCGAWRHWYARVPLRGRDVGHWY